MEMPRYYYNVLKILYSQLIIGENFYKTKIVSPKVLPFKTFEDFKDKFDMSQIENTTILIKGSRGMALERLLELIP